MSLTERIYGKETAGKPAVSSDTQKNLYTAAANKKHTAKIMLTKVTAFVHFCHSQPYR